MILLVVSTTVLVAAVVAFVVYPLLRPQRSPLDGASGQSEELLCRRDRIYTELRELEFDHRVGKVSDEDYVEAREQLETEAARILQAIDVQLKAIDDEIERQVRRLRESRRTCPSCGATVTPSARFCPSCGEPLKAMAKR